MGRCSIPTPLGFWFVFWPSLFCAPFPLLPAARCGPGRRLVAAPPDVRCTSPLVRQVTRCPSGRERSGLAEVLGGGAPGQVTAWCAAALAEAISSGSWRGHRRSGGAVRSPATCLARLPEVIRRAPAWPIGMIGASPEAVARRAGPLWKATAAFLRPCAPRRKMTTWRPAASAVAELPRASATRLARRRRGHGRRVPGSAGPECGECGQHDPRLHKGDAVGAEDAGALSARGGASGAECGSQFVQLFSVAAISRISKVPARVSSTRSPAASVETLAFNPHRFRKPKATLRAKISFECARAGTRRRLWKSARFVAQLDVKFFRHAATVTGRGRSREGNGALPPTSMSVGSLAAAGRRMLGRLPGADW